MAERVVRAEGIALCTESFGDPVDAPLLLVMGTGASMLWWEDDFCRMLSEGGRFVVRYDHRDTGRSVTYGPGRPGYTGVDLAEDAVRVLDAHGIPAAHVVGVSAGGGLAQVLALGHPDRVLSLVLISTSAAVPGVGRELPPPAEAFLRFAAEARVDWDDTDSVVEYLVASARVLAGGLRPFDERAARSLVRRDVGRAHDVGSLRNHETVPEGSLPEGSLASIGVPTLVIHGTADPLFPLAHGEALAERIPGGRLLVLEGAGHGVERADWAVIVRAVLDHTTGGPHGGESVGPRGS